MQFNTLVEAVAHWAEATPDKICLIEAETDHRLSYGEFWRLVRVFAKKLIDTDVQKGDRVVVRVTQRIDTLIAAFAIYLAGGIYVPIAQKIGEERIKELLTYFKASMFIAEVPVEYDCAFIPICAAYAEGEMLSGDALRFPNPDEVSDIIFTTGTTGAPKGVMRSFGGYIAAAEEDREGGHITSESGDVIYANHSQHLVGGIHFLRHPFTAGCTFIIGRSAFFIKDFFDSMQKYSITILSILPAECSILLSTEHEFKHYCGNIKLIYMRSAAIGLMEQKKLKSLFPCARLLLFYGATEALSLCKYDISRDDLVPLCIGKPSPNTELRIVDENGTPLAHSDYNHPGIISCRTPTLMKGYWDDAELTANTIRDGWILMGDIGYVDNDGFVYLLGRRDEVINVGGNKVSPREIEELAMETGFIKECACIPLPDEVVGNVSKLFVVMKDGKDFSAKEIYNYLSLRLEAAKRPRFIECLDALPKTEGNLKIDKKRLIS